MRQPPDAICGKETIHINPVFFYKTLKVTERMWTGTLHIILPLFKKRG